MGIVTVSLVMIATRSIFEVMLACTLEILESLRSNILSDFRAVSIYENGIHDRRTGRKCARCRGTLIDANINFGENLPPS